MRKRFLFLFFVCAGVLTGSCAGAGVGANYSCPLPKGRSCKSVSEVYDEVETGRTTVSSPEAVTKNKDAEKKKNKSSLFFHPSRSFVRQAEKRDNKQLSDAKWPIYSAPKVLRLWIAPWQDSDGIFHSEKHIHLLTEKGTWTINGKPVPFVLPEDATLENIELKEAERETPWR